MARDCKCQFYRVLSVPNSVMLMAKKRIIENLGTGPSPLDFNCLRVSLIVTRFQAGQQGGEEVGLNLERQKSSACKSSLTKHLGMNTQLFRCMYGNSFFHVQAEFCSALSEKLHWNHQLCLSQLVAFFCAGVLHKHRCLCCFQRLENASVVQVAEEGTSKEQTAGLGYIQGEQKSGNTLYSIQMLQLKTMFFHIRTLGPLQDCKRSHVDNIVFPLSRHNWDNNYSNRCFCKSSITDTLEKWWLKLDWGYAAVKLCKPVAGSAVRAVPGFLLEGKRHQL